MSPRKPPSADQLLRCKTAMKLSSTSKIAASPFHSTKRHFAIVCTPGKRQPQNTHPVYLQNTFLSSVPQPTEQSPLPCHKPMERLPPPCHTERSRSADATSAFRLRSM